MPRALLGLLLLAACDGQVPARDWGGSGGDGGAPSRPVAEAGPDRTALVGEQVRFDGSASTPRVSDLAFSWSLRTPGDSSTRLGRSDRSQIVFIPDVAGRYTVTLVVSLVGNESAPDEVIVDVTENQPPLAVLTAPAQVQRGQSFVLDGSGSSDPEGDMLTFSWGVLERPAGSRLYSVEPGARPSVVPDAPGTFRFRMTVTDRRSASATAEATVAVIPSGTEIAADAGPDRSATLGDTVTLDARGSQNLDHATSVQWYLRSRPSYSFAHLDSSTQPVVKFVPDVAGDYQFLLQLYRPPGERSEDEVTIHVVEAVGPGTVTPLAYRIDAAAYARSRHEVLIAGNDGRLHVLDPETGEESLVALPLAATALHVVPGTNTLVVGHDAYVSVVDLASSTVLHTFPVGMKVAHVAATSSHAYCFDASGAPRSIDLESGTERVATDLRVSGPFAVVHPAGDRIYSMSSSFVNRWNVVEGRPEFAWYAYLSGYQVCPPLWIAPDGGRLYTGCGTALRTGDTQDVDLGYNGTLGAVFVGALDASGDTVVSLVRPSGTPSFDDRLPRTLQVHDAEFLRREKDLLLPGFDRKGEPWPSRGLFVFLNDAEDRVVLLLQAKDGSGLPHDQGYAVVDL